MDHSPARSPTRRSSARLRACLALALLCACGKGPARVADRFVDKYYVESDQQGALQYAEGLATLKLQDELKLVSAGRGPGTQLGAQQARVYYKRGPVTGEGDSRKVDYHLDIRPQGGGALKREAHLELHRQPDGSWRVNRFNETQPH